MEEKIRALFADVLQVEVNVITDETKPENLIQWDSLNHLSLIAAFEEELQIDIDPEDIPVMMESFPRFKSVVLQKIG